MQGTAPHIAIAGFGSANDATPGASIARAMRQGLPSGAEVTAIIDGPGLRTDTWIPGLFDHMRCCRPSQAADDQLVLDWLLGIHCETALDAIIPGTQYWLSRIATLAPRLARKGIKTLVPSPDRVLLLQRSRLPKFLYERGLDTAFSIFVADTSDVAASAHQLGFPLMIKGNHFGCRPVHSPEQAHQATIAMNGAAGAGVLLQRETAGQILNVAAIVGRDGKPCAMVAMRRVAADERGRTVCGAVVDDPRITRRVEKLIDALDWCGPLEVTLLRPTGSAELLIVDVRGGLPSWSMLTQWAGYNLAVRLLQELFDDPPHPVAHARAGTLFVRGITETTVPFDGIARLERHGVGTGIAVGDEANLRAGRPDNSADGLCVAVTGISSFDVINPGLGVARALREAPDVSTLLGLGYGNFDSGAYSPELFDAAFRLPAGNGSTQLLECLRNIHRDHPIDVIVPCLDFELENFLDIREALAEMGIATLLPTKKALQRRSKPCLFGANTPSDWGAFHIPESRIADSEKGLLEAVRELGLPCVVKGPVSFCHIVYTLADAKSAWQQIRRGGADEAIVQIYIPGPCFAVAAVCDIDHRALSALTVKKLAVCERGSTWSAVHSRQPALEKDFGSFLSDIGWSGAAEGEFIRDALRDRFYLIEVNPRFTAWIYFSAALGVNHPQMLVCTAAGLPVPSPRTPSDDLVFVRGSIEIPVSATSLAALSMNGAVYHGKA